MIETFTDSQLRLIDDYLSRWGNQIRSCKAVDREKMESYLFSVYRHYGQGRPALIWCDSIWQLIGLPIVLQIIKHSRISHHKRVEFWLRKLLCSQGWQSVWKLLDEERERVREFLTRPEFSFPLDSRDISIIFEELGFPLLGNNYPIRETFEPHFDVEPWEYLEDSASNAVAEFWSSINFALQWHIRKGMWSAFDSMQRVLKSQIRSQYVDEDTQRILAAKQVSDGSPERKLRCAKHLSGKRFIPSLDPDTAYSVQSYVKAAMRQYLDGLVRLIIWPSFRCSGPLFLDLCRQLSPAGVEELEAEEIASLDDWFYCMKDAGCAAIVPLGSICLILDNPERMEFDQWQRLHCETGPAIIYRDGVSVHFWHGNDVPGWIIEKPELITTDLIEKERNMEIRRVLIERYGDAKYLLDTGAVVVNEDECGILYRKEFEDDEAIQIVKVENATVEPDGRTRSYYLRVPPWAETAREAVAWTFGLEHNEYDPLTES